MQLILRVLNLIRVGINVGELIQKGMIVKGAVETVYSLRSTSTDAAHLDVWAGG
jgi:hypothetical protein